MGKDIDNFKILNVLRLTFFRSSYFCPSLVRNDAKSLYFILWFFKRKKNKLSTNQILLSGTLISLLLLRVSQLLIYNAWFFFCMAFIVIRGFITRHYYNVRNLCVHQNFNFLSLCMCLVVVPSLCGDSQCSKISKSVAGWKRRRQFQIPL